MSRAAARKWVIPMSHEPSVRQEQLSLPATVSDASQGAASPREAALMMVVIPANAWHTFRNDGEEWLRVVGVDEGARHDAEFPVDGS